MGIMKSIKFLLLFILIPIFGLSQNPNIKNESEFQAYIDTSDFWEDSDFLNIYEQEKNGNDND